MNELVHLHTRFAPATPSAIAMINELAEAAKSLPQVPYVTEHLLHGGMYTRTIRVPPYSLIAAVLIRPPTVLICVGEMSVWANDEVTNVAGYNVVPGCAGRKIAVITHSETCFSMVVPCDAKTVEEAEKFFTPEYELLVPLSQAEKHRILITGE